MRKSRPLISVLMSAYNEEMFIGEAIESIIGQTVGEWELLVVDDASNDRTVEVIRSYDDPRISLIKNEKILGPGQAKNRALEKSKGKYIAIMDANDVAIAHRFEKQICFLESNHDVGLLGGFLLDIDLEGNKSKVRKFFENHDDICAQMLTHSPIPHISFMARSEYMLNISGYSRNFLYAEDYDLA